MNWLLAIASAACRQPRSFPQAFFCAHERLMHFNHNEVSALAAPGLGR